MDEKSLVIGIDIGTSDSYVGYIGKGTLDIVQNEVSQRKTPTLVGFTDRERLLGDSALSQIKSNAKNTCRNFKHLLGLQSTSPSVEDERFWSTSALAQAEDGFGGYEVAYKGEPQIFSATVVMAMFLTKLTEIAENWCEGKVVQAVIGVPSFFSDVHRVAMLDAARIAGLNVLSLMNEHAATALTYGFTRMDDLVAEKPLTVAFCMMGHALFSVSIVQFFQGRLKVLSEKSDKVGGRDMDVCMMRRFAAEFHKKHGCDPLSSKKAFVKLEDQVTKTKKILSANMEATCSCEYLMEDHDFSSHITRADFESMCAPMKRKVDAVLAAAKRGCGLKVSDIDVVEICGGASRVPWLKESISKAFGGKELSTRLNADECVARGCAIQAALLSPFYKVKDFKVEDVTPFPVSLSWNEAPAPQIVFPCNSTIHVLKLVTFSRKGPFELSAQYADDKDLMPGTAKQIGSVRIEVPSLPKPEKIKVRIALTSHGTVVFQSAQLLEETLPKTEEEHGKKNGLKRTELAITPIEYLGRSQEKLESCMQAEIVMREEMMEIVETNAKRNDLEAYILRMQSEAAENGKYGPYMQSEDRDAFLSALCTAEDWLWNHVDDKKDVFISKLAELKKWGDPAEARQKDDVGRKGMIATLVTRMQEIAKSQTDLSPEKKPELDNVFKATNTWIQAKLPLQKAKAKYEDPILTCAGIQEQIEAMEKAADMVITGKEQALEEVPNLMEPPQDDGEHFQTNEAVDVD